MLLEQNLFEVRDIKFGQETNYRDGMLTVNDYVLRNYLLSDMDNVQDIKLSLAKPNDKIRITNVLDAVKPMVEAGGNELFPGFLCPPVAVGSCSINVLQGVAILMSAKVDAANPLFTPKQGIVDMSGPGACYSPFSKTINLVLEIALKPDLSDMEKDHSIRMVGLKVATFLAKVTVGQETNEVISYRLRSSFSELPKVAAIIQLGGEAPLHENYVYGRSITGVFPTYIHPNEFFTGAVVGGNYTYACQRNFTYFYQDSLLLKTLYEGDGKTHSFLGAIICCGYNQSHFDKLMSANYAAMIAKRLGAEGVIITAEGAGNAHIDVMFTCQECEKLGIKTVIQIDEIAGPDGTDPSLVDFVPEADAIVSTGNREEILVLSEMKTIGASIEGTEGEIKIPVRDICGATAETGEWNVSILEY